MRSCSRVKLVLQVHTVEHFKDVKLINATQMRTSIACCAATMLLLLPVILMLQGCHLGAYHLSFGPWTFVEILGHLCHPLWANAESFWFFLMFDIFVYICLLYIYLFICQTLKALRFAQRKVMSGIPLMMVKWAMSDARLAAGGFGSQVTVARGMA